MHAGVQLSHWDRWYCVVCVEDFSGDWDGLADRLASQSGRLHAGPDAEAKLSHLDDLVARLTDADLTGEEIVNLQQADAKVRSRARRKVLDQGLGDRDYTDAMINTPRRRLRRRALRGAWQEFSVDPAGPFELLAAAWADRDHIGKQASFTVTRELEQTISEVHRSVRDDPKTLLALRRAALTAVAELAHRSDDSFGNIGELGADAWSAYVDAVWRDLVDPSIYWRDISELVVFDDYAHLYKRETLPWRHARRDEVTMIARILSALADEYRAARLGWHADEAAVAIAWLHVATRHLEGFTSIAARLGSAHWMPIVGLAERAVACGRSDIAHAVFDAADQPGWHRDYLRRRRTELLDEAGAARPRLHVVTDDG
ncbi:MAG: hypothetical protein WEB55_04940 [Acidimicrobiia bacterium]